jgi:hypothetical protein
MHNLNQKTRHNVYITPSNLTSFARTVLDTIDLDPCTTSSNPVQATHFFSDELGQDGLLEDYSWYETIWCNPPFSEVAKWVDKVISYDVPTIMLTKADSRTKWHENLMSKADCGLLIKGYTIFKFADQSSNQASFSFPIQLTLINAPTRMFSNFVSLSKVLNLGYVIIN